MEDKKFIDFFKKLNDEEKNLLVEVSQILIRQATVMVMAKESKETCK